MTQSFENALQHNDETDFEGEFSVFMNDCSPDGDQYLDALADIVHIVCRDWPKVKARLPSLLGCNWVAERTQEGRNVVCAITLIEGENGVHPPTGSADPSKWVARISAVFDVAALVVFISARTSQLGGELTKLLSTMLLQYRLSDRRGLLASQR